MSELRVAVAIRNAAFEEDPGAELARILREAAERLEQGETAGNLRDFNGNAVGSFAIQADWLEG